MSGGLFLRSFCGFALQLVPCAMLLLIPFYPSGKTFTADIKRAFTVLTTLSLAFSLCYPLSIWLNSKLPDSNLDDNLFMLLAIIVITVLFMRLVRESFIRKFTALFAVISYAAIQFFLSNMLMEFLPFAKQSMVYNDATLVAYLIVTAFILPPFSLFMRFKLRRYLNTLENTMHARLEVLFLVVVLALYLVINVLYSALWIHLRDSFRISSVYFVPLFLFLSFLLIFTLYSTVNLSVLKARNAEQAMVLALIRQNNEHIEDNIRQQKRALHDTRQLLRTISMIAKDGQKEELLQYLNEAIEYTSVSDKRYCLNPCVNGLLSYYAGIAKARGITLSVHPTLEVPPFSYADLTILLSNPLDNAVRAAEEYGASHPGTSPEILFTADIIKDQFAVQIENPCLSVSYDRSFLRDHHTVEKKWLPAKAFTSTHGSGYGLRRMEMITEKYNGHAWFSYDSINHVFITRLIMPISEV